MLQNFFDRVLPQTVGDFSPAAFLIVYAGGVLTSMSPCVLAMIPLIVGYIGGYTEHEERAGFRGFIMSAAFVLGLSVTFAVFGMVAVLIGKVVGQPGDVWYYFLAVVAVLMGLHMLEVIHIRFPAWNLKPFRRSGLLGAFLIGLVFGLAASSCATPVLAVIITYVASTGSYRYGAGLLFAYGLGQGLPLMAAGTFTAVLKQLPRFQKYAHYITRASGVVLILLGLYFLALARWY